MMAPASASEELQVGEENAVMVHSTDPLTASSVSSLHGVVKKYRLSAFGDPQAGESFLLSFLVDPSDLPNVDLLHGVVSTVLMSSV